MSWWVFPVVWLIASVGIALSFILPRRAGRRSISVQDSGWEWVWAYAPFIHTESGTYEVMTRSSDTAPWVGFHPTYKQARDVIVRRVLNPSPGAEEWVDIGGQMIRKSAVIRWGVREGLHHTPPGWDETTEESPETPGPATQPVIEDLQEGEVRF